MSYVLVGLFGTRYLSFPLKAFKRVRVRVRSRQSWVPNLATRENLPALNVFFTPQTRQVSRSTLKILLLYVMEVKRSKLSDI